MTKPFKTKELCMRIDALAQRLEPSTYFQMYDVCIDWKNRVAKKEQEIIHLTPTEREVVGCLLHRR
jgi:DNA-binding response OmpR family regulator